MKFILSVTLPGIIFLTLLLLPAQEETPPAFEKEEANTPSENDEQDIFDPALIAPKYISVQTEFIELPTNTLTRLLLDDKNTTSNATPLRMKAQELLDKEEARMLDTQLVVARSGDKATSESITEFIFPTEYEPPQPPPSPEDEKPSEKQPNIPVYYAGTPTAFETKNLGSTIEIEPRLGDSERLIDLRFLPKHVWHTGNNVWLESKDELGNISKTAMPNFYTISVDTSITCLHGEHALVSVNTPKDAEGKLDPTKKVMIFVKCKILSVIE